LRGLVTYHLLLSFINCMDKNSLWESVLADLQLSLSSANFQTWFKGRTSILSIKGGVIEIGCSNSYNKVWLEERYLGKIKEVCDKITGTSNSVLFTVASHLPSHTQTKKPSGANETTVPLFEEVASQSIKDSLESANINQRYSLTNFLVGQSNQLAFAVSKAVVDKPFERYNPLLIAGGVGVGKTHLLQAIGHSIILRRAGVRVLYTTSETFTNQMVDAIQRKDTSSFRNKYRNIDVLLLDDVQFIAGRESTQEEFFHTFNHLYAKGKQIILSSDRPPAELPALQERIKNRFSGGMLALIDQPEQDLREAILLAKSKALGLDLEFSLIRVMAASLGPSVRDIEGGLNRILAVSSLTGKRVDETLVASVLVNERVREKSPKQILEETADFFSLTPTALKSQKRDKTFVFPRQAAMYLLRTGLGISFKEIGELLGGRDHTTVLYSVNKVEKLVEKNGEISTMLAELRTKVLG
jgi:chromosomal replication initiator protein